MAMNPKRFQQTLDGISFLILFLSLVIVIGWTTNQEFFLSFSKEGTFAAILSSGFALGCSIYYSIYKLSVYFEVGTWRKSLSEAIHAQCQDKRITNLRIMAVTTGKIYPLVAASNVYVDHCVLMLPFFDNANKDSDEERNNRRCIELVKDWRSLAALGRIGRLEIFRINHWPDQYISIADRSSLTFGLYTYSSMNKSLGSAVAEFSDAMFIRPLNANTREVFSMIYDWFEQCQKTCQPWD